MEKNILASHKEVIVEVKKITDRELFDWVRANQDDGRLLQEQVDAIDTLLAITDATSVVDILSKVNGWGLPDSQIPDTPIPETPREYILTQDTLKKVYPTANVNVVPLLLKYAPEYGVTSKKQMCSFIATCIIESNGFNAKRESFAYSAKRLTQVFPKSRIPNLPFAQTLVNQGQKSVANHLYNGRMGNRVGSDDGWNYRGNSWIQLTGRDNHYAMQKLTGIPVGDNPELLQDLETACIVTMAWWKVNGLNEMAEKINTYSDGYTLNTLDSKGIETNNYEMNYGARIVRKAVNGGFNGYTEFCKMLEKCFKCF